MSTVCKLIPTIALAMSLAPFAANARSSAAPLPSQSMAAPTYTLSAASDLHGRAAERSFGQRPSQNISVAEQFMNRSPANATIGG